MNTDDKRMWHSVSHTTNYCSIGTSLLHTQSPILYLQIFSNVPEVLQSLCPWMQGCIGRSMLVCTCCCVIGKIV